MIQIRHHISLIDGIPELFRGHGITLDGFKNGPDVPFHKPDHPGFFHQVCGTEHPAHKPDEKTPDDPFHKPDEKNPDDQEGAQ